MTSMDTFRKQRQKKVFSEKPEPAKFNQFITSRNDVAETKFESQTTFIEACS